MSKEETVEVTIKVPKAIVEFLRALGENVLGEKPEEYMVRQIVDSIAADLEADAFFDPKEFVRKFNLLPVFEKYGVSPSCHIDPREAEAK